MFGFKLSFSTKISLSVLQDFLLRTPIGWIWLFGMVFLVFGELVNAYYKNGLSSKTPRLLRELFTYGKSKKETDKVTGKLKLVEEAKPWWAISVKKSWFKHFYMTSVVCNSTLLYYTFQSYIHSRPSPFYVNTIIDLCTFGKYTNPPHFQTTDHFSTLLCLALLCFQGSRRLYECFHVSVYSNSTIHILHYLLGHFFYAAQAITLLFASPSIAKISKISAFEWEDFGMRHVVFTCTFLLASYIQYDTHWRFGQMRKSKNGIHQNDHGIPQGGGFEYVSCPHLMSECFIYLSLYGVVGWGHFVWGFLVFFVVVNQTLAAVLTHKWYKDNFRNYPKKRRAVIPFLV